MSKFTLSDPFDREERMRLIEKIDAKKSRYQTRVNRLRSLKAVNKEIRYMEIGEYGWSVPWGFTRDGQGNGYLWPSYTVKSTQPEPDRTNQMFVAYTGRGFIVSLYRCDPEYMDLKRLERGTPVRHTIAVRRIYTEPAHELAFINGEELDFQ